jgi:single-strand DNA-binding protein
MANLNKVMLIGRLTRDPETRVFTNGGKVANFGFAVNNRRKNASTGEWEDEPVFIDIKAFNRENGRKLADLVEQHMRKGHQFYIEGHLTFEQWTSQEGQKQSKLKVIMDDFQFFEPRQDGGEGGARPARAAAAPAARKPAAASPPTDDEFHDEPPAAARSSAPPTEEEIPF